MLSLAHMSHVSLNPVGLMFFPPYFYGYFCAMLKDLPAFNVTKTDMKIYVWSLCFRVVYLQVSMNEGLSFITSSVHITTTECVSLTTNTHTQHHMIQPNLHLQNGN